MKLLLLGGTADARYLADALHQAGIRVIYSLAGLVRVPKVDCELVVGGFTQFGGLASYLRQNKIDMILDVTHPYAQTMSQKAVTAAHEVGIACWRFHRPAWRHQEGDLWTGYQDDDDLLEKLNGFQHPLMSAGQLSEVFLSKILEVQSIQQVIWRTAVAPKFAIPGRVTWLKAIGPFSLEDEMALLKEHQVDCIVSKNSGGSSTYAKLEAARALGISVLLHVRPELPQANKEFYDTNTCLQACLALQNKAQKSQQDNQQ